jgi:hypothetical protein
VTTDELKDAVLSGEVVEPGQQPSHDVESPFLNLFDPDAPTPAAVSVMRRSETPQRRPPAQAPPVDAAPPVSSPPVSSPPTSAPPAPVSSPPAPPGHRGRHVAPPAHSAPATVTQGRRPGR